ncbi:hypothetical protein B566_EDAN010009 [Ephemera danica]|nr:hypothetical protein B566_EDAN010009 [Ephemera danica]
MLINRDKLGLKMMHMTFWTGVDIGDFMVHGLKVVSMRGLAATCVGLGCLALLAEGARALLLHLQNGSPMDSENITIPSSRVHILLRLCQALVFALHATISYVLMLAVMSYNIAIFIAVIIGSSLGYAIFRTTPVMVLHQAESIEPTPVGTESLGEDVHSVGPSGAIMSLRYAASDTPLIHQ